MSGWSDPRGWHPKNFTFIEKVIAGTIVGLLIVIFFASKQMAAERQRFMDDCMQDHKEYECTLMWKEAQPDTQTVVIPVYTQ